MKISLEINGVSLELESHIDQPQLMEAGFKKVDIFTRLFLPFQKKKGDIIFFVKNPTITVFNNKVKAVANLDTSMGADTMNGTSCFAIFNQDRLRYIICQVMQGNIAAPLFAKDVRQAALNELGEPTAATGGLKLWQEGKQTFKSVIDPSGRNAFIHWLTE
jgi:hypothetical protein